MASTAEAFQTAVAHHRAGRFVEAAGIYRQILQVEPQHADALHLLGVASHQSGQHDAAIACISRAIVLRGGDAAFHSNLGEVYRALGKLDDASKCYRQALRLDPALPESHNNFGTLHQLRGDHTQAIAAFQEALRLRPAYPDALSNLGLSLRQLGDLAGAAAQFRQALQIDPQFSRAYDNLGTTLKLQGDLVAAVACYREALARDPANVSYQFNLGVLYQQQQQYAQAVTSYREVLRLNPRFSEAHNNLGTVLKELEQYDEAIASYRRALAINPQMAESHYNIGVVLSAQGRRAEAIEQYRQALAIQPDYVKALVNYGGLVEGLGQLDEAMACFERVIQLQPELAIGHFSYGNICRYKRTLADAVAAFQKAISLRPDYADAFNNLAVTYSDLGQPDESEKCCRKGLEFAPTLSPLYSNLAIALLAQGRGEEAIAERRKALSMRPSDAVEHSNLVYDLNFMPGYDPPTLFAEHLEWARRHAEPHTAAAPPHANDGDPERRLRIGYVSPYFRIHAVNYFTEPILLAHDHAQFEVFCYSDVLRPDATTARLKAAADCWREIYPLTTAELVDLVRGDRIDILVDLTGHIGMNRLTAFAHKPAPVQVTYIGYQNTTGMSAMDYRLTDAHADPPGLTDRIHTETLVRLPRSFFCYRPNDDAPGITGLPALERGAVTFGSFNKYVKVNQGVIDAWLRILVRVPDSRLLVLAYRGGYAEKRLHVAAAARGIDPTRIEFLDKLPHAEYMQLLARADIALDPFPFTGHTTTCDCVWMGVPVVMLEGQTYVTRFGGSVHRNVGLESWIADSVDQYVDIAVRAASDIESLARLRAELRPRMAASPLLDFAAFTRNLEDAYRQMWRAWCAGRRWQHGLDASPAPKRGKARGDRLMPNVAETFDAAVRFHQAGELREAEQAYLQVLADDPRHAPACERLGMLALGAGKSELAADYARRAIDLDPRQAGFYPTLAEACRRLGRIDEAIAAYREALVLRPEFPEAHCNLGTLVQGQGDLTGAAACYRNALAIAPDHWYAHHNLAVVLQISGDLDAAAEQFAAAASANPLALESRLALGYLLQARGNSADATRFFEEAVAQWPNSAAAHCGLGYTYQCQGMFDEAIAQYRRAYGLAPSYAMAYFNHGTALGNLGRREEALQLFRECLTHDPNSLEATLGVAGIELELGRPDPAVIAGRRAVELAPGSRTALAQLAAALHAQGDLDGAIAAHRRVVELDPTDFGGHSNLLYAMTLHEAIDAEACFAEHRIWAARHAEPLTAAAAPHGNDRSPDRRLRVGYVSAHFRHHAVSFFSEPMIAAHDHAKFEVVAYSDVRNADEVTERFRAACDAWRDVAQLSDEALAALVREDGIDILVDLAGHIGGNRLLAFAHKPAPVQVTYLGYQNTTGMSAMDYRLTDAHADPPGMTDRYYTERLVRLPRAFFCYAPPGLAPEVRALPALSAGCVTFASLNQSIKLRPRAWQAWMRILSAVPGSKLLVMAHHGGQLERNARALLERSGIDPARLEILDKRPRFEYLQLHGQIDLALDSFPFNGHTTVCDALWMGVPSIMLEGSSYASRFGGSVMRNVGLEELVAHTEDEYVDTAVRLAGRLDRVAELRRTMRDRLRGSPLVDAAGFTAHLEAAYRQMWHEWCSKA